MGPAVSFKTISKNFSRPVFFDSELLIFGRRGGACYKSLFINAFLHITVKTGNMPICTEIYKLEQVRHFYRLRVLPLQGRFLMCSGAIPQVEIYKRLIRHSNFLSQVLEIIDNIFIHSEGNLTFVPPGIWVFRCLGKIVFFSHFHPLSR